MVDRVVSALLALNKQEKRTDMTHIGIDARLTYYRDGGISTYIRRLVQELAQMTTAPDHDYTIFQSRKDRTTLTSALARRQLWTPAHHRIERLALSVELAWRGLDVWHSPDFIPPYRAAKRHVITVHDLTFLHYPDYLTADSRRYYNQQIQWACHHADHILADSRATKRDIIDLLNIPADKITVHALGVSEQYRPLPASAVQAVQAALDLPPAYILHVGTLEPRKNIIGLLKAYRLLLEQLPDAPPIVLVGRRGWLFEQTEREMQALNLGDKLIWRDNVSDGQLPAVYNGAVTVVTPSFYEGFGFPALEGMACGIVPIVSNRSSLPEVVGDVGYQVNPDDVTSIASALHDAIQHYDDMPHQAALERAQQFTWRACAEIALHTYERVR